MTAKKRYGPLPVRARLTVERSATKVLRQHRARRGLDWIGGTGFGFTIETEADLDLARRVMEFHAVNQRGNCRMACVHLALDWPALRPTRREMEEAGCAALSALGMGNADAVFIGRNGWQHCGMHVVASKIDPESGRAYQLHRYWVRLQWWARRYGRGWK